MTSQQIAPTTPPHHEHAWKPDWNGVARYRCACGARGYRRRIFGGVGREIVPYR